MIQQKFNLKNRIKSFDFAFNGLKILLREEHNARIHVVGLLCALLAGLIFKIALLEWLAIILVSGLVFTTEIINSSLEKIADFVSPERHSSIKKIKDLSAAGVLVSAFTALIIGLIIFLPKILKIC
jgi:diacylglycerol kinase